MTLRARLTLLYLAIATLAVVGLGTTAYVVSRDATLSSVDRTLEADGRTIESSFEHLGGPISQSDIDGSRLMLDRHAVEGLVFQVRNDAGIVLYSSGGGAILPASELGQPDLGWQTLELSDSEVRALVRPLVRFGETIGSVEVRAPLTQANASIAATRNVLIVGGLVAIVLTGGVAFLVAGRAAAPVVALSRLAREIERTADFARRLPDRPSTLEMREMAATFNRMIGRVEDMLTAQRRFLSDTSHELRRPLTILRTDIDILTDPGLSPEDLSNVQEEMRIAAASMSGLLTELLILARQDEDVLHKELVDLSAICRSACQTAAALHPRHSFEVHLPQVVWIEGDSQRLERMVINVILNAASYTEDPGVIECSLTAQADTAKLVITDTGPGMAPRELEHIFERFFRGGAGRRIRPEGTGLGLPIVKQIARAHGGEVFVESQAGHGTTVTIHLPAKAVRSEALASVQAI